MCVGIIHWRKTTMIKSGKTIPHNSLDTLRSAVSAIHAFCERDSRRLFRKESHVKVYDRASLWIERSRFRSAELSWLLFNFERKAAAGEAFQLGTEPMTRKIAFYVPSRTFAEVFFAKRKVSLNSVTVVMKQFGDFTRYLTRNNELGGRKVREQEKPSRV